MQRFPYPPYTDDTVISALADFVGLFFVCAFLLCAIFTVKSLTQEKESQIKEAMKIMGLPNWLHWTAWFVKTFILFFLAVILIVILLKIKVPDYAILTMSNTVIILLLFFFWVCASVTQCFAVSVFFKQANTAAAVSSLVWFLLYFPYGIKSGNYGDMGQSEKLAMCLASNSALGLAFRIIFNYEGQGIGIQWKHLFEATSQDDGLTLGHIFLMLIVDTFLYLLIALYVEAIYPGDYGVPKPWYFPFTKEFWVGNKQRLSKL